MTSGLKWALVAILMPILQAPAFGQEAAMENPNILYLRENAEKDGVIVRPNGLQIRIIKRGEGSTPGLENQVTVHYEGKLVDGTVFDSSYARGTPATFAVGGVIEAWQDALVLMRVGGIWEIAVPARLGYGQQGSRDVIPPGATLIFKIELLEIH